MGCKKQGAKNRVIVIQKEKRRPGTLLFALHILDLIFFQGRKPTHVFKTRIVGAGWLGEYVVINNTKTWKKFENIDFIFF